MHDLDRTMLESEMEGEFEAGQGPPSAEREEFLEVLGEIVGEGYETESEAGEPSRAPVQSESEQTELALELLGVSTEQELDRFLGKLVSRAAGAVRDFGRTQAGQALKGMAKSAISQALPAARRAVADWLPPAHGDWDPRAGQATGDLLGLEMEGLSQEDREFETAQALVRWTADAAKRAATMSAQAPPARAAKAAAVAAAQRLAPGLASVLTQMPVPGGATGGPSLQAQSGRWVRRGNTVVLHGF
jgi:hypothetical protein